MLNRKASAPAAIAVAILLAGCGSGKHYVNAPRPPSLLIITVAIDNGRVLVSPTHIGAGPVQLTMANETQASQQVTVASDQPGVLQEHAGPINPGNTASLKANLSSGTYSVKVDGSSIQAATIAVGGQRPSAQNQLLQP
jgi:hypothetical protein